MRDYVLFHPKYGDYPVSEVATWRLEEINSGKRHLENAGLLVLECRFLAHRRH